ncbi:tRNA epoxyqueuosine(34) reductase QueG [Chondromyces apiculatus]|uniref:Epoxyqueuosine (OQ) reductase QueG n=1 Tax=Chondromyces apiculatus DSM 436 TaxID=1192034 RepID=A0A017T9I4_9BACT|nr:tRNA epoxyqueuosine(34) reductase QueG [Chondromyces apiculatus]EYF05281.1 Epoxyqueuosine (oQ) reductase QueG [Chondromyces apiculatus DSM 436]
MQPELDRQVREQALALGFDVVGVARADEPLDADHDRYRAFIDQGMHGEMDYLARYVEERRRLDTSAILEGARSVICVGRRYARPSTDEGADPPVARSIARYARGRDYHNHLKKQLRKLAQFIEALAEGVRARALCDIEPVLERAWAARSGIGFVGKNGLVITPGQGSYQMLGEVVTTLDLVADVPLRERCGSCTRCLDACPTQAFDAPFVLDPRRCIAYLTIEHRSTPPAALQERVGEHVFGCDVCQEVCPFNRTAPPAPARTTPFHPLSRWEGRTLDDLVTLDQAAFDTLTEGSPVRRARRAGLARNAAIVAANRLARGAHGEEAEAAARALDAALQHDDASVREVAARGAERLGKARAT